MAESDPFLCRTTLALVNGTSGILIKDILIKQSSTIIPLLLWGILCYEKVQQKSSSIGLQQQY